MALSVENYVQQLQSLLLLGKAWTRNVDSVLTNLLKGIAKEFARIDARADDLIMESDPRTTSELIEDWERVADLPDPCVTVAQTIEQRRVALTSKLTMQGGQSRKYFINLAASMGYADATIDEYRPMNCNDDCNDALYSADDRYFWTINLPSTSGIFVMNCNSTCNDALRAWGDEAIECRINKYKPAHTTAIFAYV
ncbi:MAG: DUF2313 domain-containing protein [Methylotenera sp.]|nr:DUF2313 domain-containing protein [Methylotenera sp.]